MVAGYGFGQRAFLGYGSTIDCSHCHNRVVEMIYATYDYEFVGPIRWKHLGERGSLGDSGSILVLCPTCMYGLRVLGEEAVEQQKKTISKSKGGAAAAAFAIDADLQLKAVEGRFDIKLTAQWLSNQNFLARRSYTKILGRLGLVSLKQRLVV